MYAGCGRWIDGLNGSQSRSKPTWERPLPAYPPDCTICGSSCSSSPRFQLGWAHWEITYVDGDERRQESLSPMLLPHGPEQMMQHGTTASMLGGAFHSLVPSQFKMKSTSDQRGAAFATRATYPVPTTKDSSLYLTWQGAGNPHLQPVRRRTDGPRIHSSSKWPQLANL